jgi:hypothetical protein
MDSMTGTRSMNAVGVGGEWSHRQRAVAEQREASGLMGAQREPVDRGPPATLMASMLLDRLSTLNEIAQALVSRVSGGMSTSLNAAAGGDPDRTMSLQDVLLAASVRVAQLEQRLAVLGEAL